MAGVQLSGRMDAEEHLDDIIVTENDIPTGAIWNEQNYQGSALMLNTFVRGGKITLMLDYDKDIYTAEEAESFIRGVTDSLSEISEYLETASPKLTPSDLGELEWSMEEFEAVRAGFAADNVAIQRILPLSGMQEAMLLKHMAEPDSFAYRLVFVKVSDKSGYLITVSHHIIQDGWSMQLYMEDLWDSLAASKEGRILPETDNINGVYEQAVRELSHKDRDKALNYWSALLSDYETRGEIPSFGEVPPAERTDDEDTTLLSAKETEEFSKLCMQSGATLSNGIELAWRKELLDINENSRHAQHSSFSFDASLDDLLCPVAFGGSVHILGDEIRKDMTEMVRYFSDNDITGLTMPTQMGMAMLDQFPEMKVKFLILSVSDKSLSLIWQVYLLLLTKPEHPCILLYIVYSQSVSHFVEIHIIGMSQRFSEINPS